MALVTILATLSVIPLHAKAEYDYQLTTNPFPDVDPKFSPNGGKILYTEYGDSSWSRHIAVMNSDGSGKEPLTNGGVDGYPAYSPDGTRIAFARWGFRGDFWDLMMMNADGSGVVRITFAGIPGKMEGSYCAPKWSEDGTRLVFYYTEGSTSNQIAYWICTVNVDGTGPVVIGRGTFPRFVHDDTKILFNTDSHVDATERIAIMDNDGTNVKILTNGPADVCPHMSSKTNRILFFRISDGNLYVMNEDGTNLKPILTSGEIGAQAEWSPDEKWIAYSSTESGNFDIWKREAPQRAPSKWAVVIGVNEYSYPNKNARGGPGNSAKDMYDILVNYMNFPSDHVHLLIDKVSASDDDVARATVEREFRWLQTIAIPEDVVVFYYAGHGAQSPTLGNEYIIMHDGEMRDDEFTIETNKIESKNLLVILDTSYSGGFVTDAQTLWQGIWGIIPSWTDLASETPSSRIILTSCAENVGPWLGSRPLRDAQELPYWSPDAGWRYEMVFTHLLATGFKGRADSNKDGKVTVEEAFRFARPRALVETPLMYDGYPVYGSSEELYLG
jgi:TolB protein